MEDRELNGPDRVTLFAGINELEQMHLTLCGMTLMIVPTGN